MAVNIKIEQGINVFTKEEELVYRKYVVDVVEETDEITVEGTEQDEIDEQGEAEPIDEVIDDGVTD